MNLKSSRVEIHGNRHDVALKYLDKLLLVCPDYEAFDLNDVIREYEPDYSKTEQIRELKPEITELLIEIHNYADLAERMSNMKLNEIGRYVKSVGGHFAYTEKVNREDRKAAKEKRNEKWKNNAALVISILAFLLYFATTIDLIPFSKKTIQDTNNQQQIDSVFKLIKNLEGKVEKMEKTYSQDSISIK